jgi:hypothetical protein
MAEQKQQLTPGQREALDNEKDRLRREQEKKAPTTRTTMGEGKLKFKKGGYVKAADGCAVKGKTKGRMV